MASERTSFIHEHTRLISKKSRDRNLDHGLLKKHYKGEFAVRSNDQGKMSADDSSRGKIDRVGVI